MNELTKPIEVITAPIKSTTSEPAMSFLRLNKNFRLSLLLPATLVAAWLGTTTIAFYLKSTQLLIGFDGGYMLNLAQRQFAWHVPLLSTSMDWFQGLGDVFYAVNFRLLPDFIAGSLFASTTATKVVIYEALLCELSIAIVVFGLSLGASRTISVAAALVTCLTFLPFDHPTLIYGILPMTPYMGLLNAAALLVGAAFFRFGRRNWLIDLPYALIVLALLGWSFLVSITTMLLAAPFLLVCAISGTIGATGSAERRCKIGLLAVVGLFLTATGPAIYLISTILDTAAVIFPGELENNRASFPLTSILFHWNHGAVGPILMIFGIAGAALAALDRTCRALRIFALTMLTYLSSRMVFAILIIVFDFWRGPAPLYFEFVVIPLYALFAAYFCGRVLERLWRLRGWVLLSGADAEIRLVGASIVAILTLAIATSRSDYGFPYPPASTEITDIVSRETGLQLGSVYRGRTADMIGRSIARSVDWLDLHGIDGSLAGATGNELRLVGLHYFGIPGLFQYTPTITPFMYAVSSRLLALPGDKQMRNIMVLRDIDPRLLAMLGVRFVITDRAYNGPVTLRATVPIKDRTLFLYEIGKPNVGDYTPTTVRRMTTATEIITRLADQNFDPAREMIADIPNDVNGLVPARNARLTFLGASLRLQAESDGRSVLLVPLEFSRCLQAQALDYEKPVLFRTDLLETGVLFSGRLDTILTIRTGPFLDPACRLRDLLDARALGVGRIPPRIAQTQLPGGH